ncbi:hypothetical protein [Pseudomonas sp. SJZ079]|uniref:hypothetical protein n=1 Tax=Pseudomonas sp. SJZ079 TaxID=2572887 RepID=UPI0011BE2269|nr:hypothetical protein [Pseudomonas sp. SJZ079]
MRKFNITLMLCIAVITACLGLFLFLVETRGIAYWATSTLSLLAISVISLAYAIRLIKTNIKSAKVQAVIFISYIVTLVAVAIMGSGAGSIPYIMQSMEIDFIPALKYIWPALLLGAAIATISCLFAHALITRKHSSNTALTYSA